MSRLRRLFRLITRRQVLVAGMAAPWSLPAFPAAGDVGLVRLLIDTPRESLIETLAGRIRGGLGPAEAVLVERVALEGHARDQQGDRVGVLHHFTVY